jgi:cytochrome c5
MNRRRVQIISLILFGLCCGSAVLHAQVPVEVGRRDWTDSLPDGEGKGLLLGTCTQCHSLNHVALQRKDAKGWQHTMEDMIMRGAQVHEHEIAPMVAYLTQYFGPGSPSLESGSSIPAASTAQPKSAATTLPEGEGKDLIMRSCNQCHGMDKITGSRKDLKGWQTCVKDMVRLGAKLRPAEQPKVVAYLVKNFGR